MKKVLLTGLLLIVCYQCSGMYSDALGTKKNFDKNEKGSLSQLSLDRATNPLIKMRTEVKEAGEDHIIDWIVNNTSSIKKMRILTPNEALLLLNALGSRENAEAARKVANEFKEKLINPTTSQNSMLPQISISEEAEAAYEILNHEADLAEEQEYKLAKVAYEILIDVFNRAIKQREESLTALLETLVNKAITEAQQEVKAEAERKQTAESKESKGTTYREITLESALQQSTDAWEQWQQDFLEEQLDRQLDQLEQQQATNTQTAASSSSITPTRLPKKLDAIAEGNESKSTTVTMQELAPSNPVETKQDTTPSEPEVTQPTGFSSIRSTRQPDKLKLMDVIAEGNETEDEEQQAEASTTDSLSSPSDTTEAPLESIVIDNFKEIVIPIQTTSGSESYFGGMPISGEPQLPRVLDEFKFLSPFAGAFAGAGVATSGQQQLGSQRPQTPAQTAQRVQGLFQSSAAKQKTMAEEKKS